MPLDYAYKDGDLVLDENGEPERYQGAMYKASRQLAAEHEEIDGVPVGNYTWTELRREIDSPVNRQIAQRYCQMCLEPLGEQGTGELAEIETSTDDPDGQSGCVILSSFRDVVAKKSGTTTIPVLPPWGS